MATALAKLPAIKLPAGEQPRLIEFVRFGMAIAEAMGKDGKDFYQQFKTSREDSIYRTIDASPVASAVVEWFKDHPTGLTATAKYLREAIATSKPPHCDSWPRSASAIRSML